MNCRLIKSERIVQVYGEIDLSNSSILLQELEYALSVFPCGFIIDFTETTYMDSQGIREILAVYRELESANGILVIIVSTQIIKKIIDLVNLHLLPNIAVCEDYLSAREVLDRHIKSDYKIKLSV